MTETEYQQAYANGTMDPKTRIEYERYLAWKKFNQMVIDLPIDAPATENMTFYEQLPIFPIDDTTKIVSNNKNVSTNRSIFSDISVNKQIKNKDVSLINKKLKPNYGKMPGFKLPPKDIKGKSTGNYWSVDETSPFWQTDAGYEKAMQTWGEKPGWVKPGFRPKKQELDINAIKKWFTPS
jgi:hypothetical protein